MTDQKNAGPLRVKKYFFQYLCLFLSVCFHAVRDIRLEPTKILFKRPYSKFVVTAAQCCERIQDKHKALVSAGSLKPLSQEAHVRDVLKVGFASRFLQTIRYFLRTD